MSSTASSRARAARVALLLGERTALAAGWSAGGPPRPLCRPFAGGAAGAGLGARLLFARGCCCCWACGCWACCCCGGCCGGSGFAGGAMEMRLAGDPAGILAATPRRPRDGDPFEARGLLISGEELKFFSGGGAPRSLFGMSPSCGGRSTPDGRPGAGA